MPDQSSTHRLQRFHRDTGSFGGTSGEGENGGAGGFSGGGDSGGGFSGGGGGDATGGFQKLWRRETSRMTENQSFWILSSSSVSLVGMERLIHEGCSEGSFAQWRWLGAAAVGAAKHSHSSGSS